MSRTVSDDDRAVDEYRVGKHLVDQLIVGPVIRCKTQLYIQGPLLAQQLTRAHPHAPQQFN